MSFSDAIGKLQSVLSSFGAEETKKTEKKEDVAESSVFSSAISDVNEEADITGIEIDYSQAASEVADRLFINKEIYRNAEDAKEWSERVNQELDSANIPESLKDELAPLYSQLCEATDSNQREYISAKIKQKYLEAEANGADGTDFEKLDLNLQRFSSLSAQGKAVSDLFEQLAETDDHKMKDKIRAEINKTQADFSAEQEKLFMQSYIREFDLSEEQIDGLSDWYSQLGEATDEDSRARIQAEIKNFCAEQGIDPNSEMILGLDFSAAHLARRQDLSLLYEQAIHTNSDKQLDMIYREINLKNSEQMIKTGEIEQKMIISEMDIDDETKQKVFELLGELSGVIDLDASARTNAEIANLLANAGVDLNGQDFTHFLLASTDLQMEKENLVVYEQLVDATDPKVINELNDKLNYIYDKYQDDFNRIHEKLDQFQQQRFLDNLGEMYNDLSNATSVEDRNAIIEDIKDMVDNQNKEILEKQIFESYFDLYDIDSEAEKDQKIAEIQSLHSQYGDIVIDEKLSELFEQLSEARDTDTRERIRDEIKAVESNINKKAELKNLYEQLSQCQGIAEREMILAKIKELE